LLRGSHWTLALNSVAAQTNENISHNAPLAFPHRAYPEVVRRLAASRRGLCARGETVEIGKRDRLAVGKLDDETQLAAHRLDIGTKRRQQKVAALSIRDTPS
jgi:hypothetical protein